MTSAADTTASPLSAASLMPTDDWIDRVAREHASLCVEFIPVGRPVAAADIEATAKNLLDIAHLAERIGERVSDGAVRSDLLPSGADVTAAYIFNATPSPAYANDVRSALATIPAGATVDEAGLQAVALSLVKSTAGQVRGMAAASAEALLPAVIEHANRPPAITLDRPLGRILLIDERQGQLSDEDLAVIVNKLLDSKPISVAVAAETDERATNLKIVLNTYRICPRDRIHAYGAEAIAELPADKREKILDGIANGKVDVIGRADHPAQAALGTFAAPALPVKQATRGGDSR